jgi:hypothetical protein
MKQKILDLISKKIDFFLNDWSSQDDKHCSRSSYILGGIDRLRDLKDEIEEMQPSCPCECHITGKKFFRGNLNLPKPPIYPCCDCKD